MHINEESEKVHANLVIYIPPHTKQSIENSGTSDLKFLCIVDSSWQPQNEEIL